MTRLPEPRPLLGFGGPLEGPALALLGNVAETLSLLRNARLGAMELQKQMRLLGRPSFE